MPLDLVTLHVNNAVDNSIRQQWDLLLTMLWRGVRNITLYMSPWLHVVYCGIGCICSPSFCVFRVHLKQREKVWVSWLAFLCFWWVVPPSQFCFVFRFVFCFVLWFVFCFVLCFLSCFVLYLFRFVFRFVFGFVLCFVFCFVYRFVFCFVLCFVSCFVSYFYILFFVLFLVWFCVLFFFLFRVVFCFLFRVVLCFVVCFVFRFALFCFVLFCFLCFGHGSFNIFVCRHIFHAPTVLDIYIIGHRLNKSKMSLFKGLRMKRERFGCRWQKFPASTCV